MPNIRQQEKRVGIAARQRLQNLRYSPELHFELDPSIEYSVHISKRLREILPPAGEEEPERS